MKLKHEPQDMIKNIVSAFVGVIILQHILDEMKRNGLIKDYEEYKIFNCRM